MKHLIYLAGRYVWFHRWRSLVLLVCLSLTFFLPLSIHRLVGSFEEALWERSEATPMVLGAKGSRFDLVLHSLYFQANAPSLISVADLQALVETDLGQAIPIFSSYRARGYPIVGTSLDYFGFRRLRVATGRSLIHLGECVLGAKVASALELKVGQSLMSDPENVFNIAGEYPLKMQVVGILAANETVDDEAVFVDTKTAWIIAGIGHGHDAVAEDGEDERVLRREGQNVVANAALLPYLEVTEANRDSFHFHAAPEDRPLTALLFAPRDAKAGTLLRGRYLGDESRLQVLRPREVVEEMMTTVSRVKQFMDVNFMIVGGVVALFLVLVVWLSVRLREREIETLFLIGCRRGTVWGLLAFELGLISLASLGLTVLLTWSTDSLFENWLTQVFS